MFALCSKTSYTVYFYQFKPGDVPSTNKIFLFEGEIKFRINTANENRIISLEF